MKLTDFLFTSEIDFNLIRKNFEIEWINDLDNLINLYLEQSNSFNSKTYFSKPGFFYGRNDEKTPKEISDYFKRILYAPNIYILDFVCKNKEFFKNQIFLDNGAGIGVLSVFLKKLGISCYNYDDFSQIKNGTFHILIEEKLGLKIEEVKDTLPKYFNVLTSSGIGIINPEFLNHKIDFIMIDSRYDLDSNYISKGIINELALGDNYLKYSDLTIYKKK